MAASSTGHGYWLVAADGGVFTFGDAPFFGSMGGAVLNDPVVEMVTTPRNGGYLMVATDGEVFHFGSAGFYGSLAGGYGGDPTDVPPIAGIALTTDGQGYWLLEPDGWSYGFTNPPSPAPSVTASAIVSIANGQVNSDPDKGRFCNPYGPVRGVVRPVRHLGVGARRRTHPVLPLHRQHLQLGRRPHRGAASDRCPAARGRRPLRDQSVLHGHLGPRGPGRPGLAGRGRGDHRG